MTNLSTELARLAEAATAGPWEATKDVRKPYKRLYSCPAIYSEEGMVAETLAGLPGEENNAALIVALRNAVPELLSALRAQQHAEALADGMDRAITFIEALADNDLDEPIADNGMTVGAKLQMDAPPLIFKLRAALAAYRSVKP